jgi:hypothetical protein
MSEVGYELDRCTFCGKPEAGYQRAKDSSPQGPFFDACESCARKHYPQPKSDDGNDRNSNATDNN